MLQRSLLHARDTPAFAFTAAPLPSRSETSSP
jgi:hypothetical protein